MIINNIFVFFQDILFDRSNYNYSDVCPFRRYRQFCPKWHLWHGNVIKALSYLDELDVHDIENDYAHLDSFIKQVEDFIVYITNNAHYITNYGERQRNGEVFTSTFAESTINEVIARRFSKKQQMQWSKKGAHLMLQARTKVLNGDLADCFKKWYPNLKIEQEEVKKVA